MAARLARSQRTAHGPPLGRGRSLVKLGDLLGNKYRVERILGEGGMGVVVAAYHELLDQRVAVKLLYQDVADHEASQRLVREAQSTAKLQSDHVARVVDVDVGGDGLPFIVMELLEGSDLCQLADARGALPRWLVVDYMLQALEGLAHAHARGIVHRDLKPSNLFLANRADGTQVIKILDFGISKSQDSNADRRTQQLTGGRTVLGSPPYMSPEQVRSPKTVDHRTDIWSLGICMYELLTNAMPFGGDELQETFAQILERSPMPIRQLVTGVPEGLEHVVMKCLAKTREERFADVGELARALAPFGSGAWVQSPERVAATLARPLVEEPSGARLKGAELPLSARRLDSMQPELHGTTSTLAHPFTTFESKKRWIMVGFASLALAGIFLIGITTIYRSRGVAAGAAGDIPSDPPPAVMETAGLATQALSASESSSAAPAGTVIGASQPGAEPPVIADDPAATTAATAARGPRGVGVRPPSTRKPPPGGKPLPADLPNTRSGQ